MTEALQGAAVKYLLSISDVVNVVGKTPQTNKPYIFRDEEIVNLESGHYQPVSAIVVQDAGPIVSLQLSRFRGRRLRITIWANGSRDVSGNLTGPKATHDKIATTFAVLDRYMHRTSPETVVWGDYRTLACNRIIDLSEPIAVSEGDGIMIASVYYEVFF